MEFFMEIIKKFPEPPKICPVCQKGEQFKSIKNYQDRYNKFSLFECKLCKVQFWTPFRCPGSEWYEKQDDFEARSALNLKIYRGYHKKFLKLHKNFPQNTKILDLGCGSCEFITELRKRGCEVWGVDFDKNLIDIAKKKFNLENVYGMSFDDFFQKSDLPQFDIVTFFEIIEHLNNPLEFIENVKKILKPTGRIFLSTPSRERLLVNLARWDFPPHHLTRWNREAVSNLFQKVNFRISCVDYLEQFKFLLSAMNGKFRLGIVNKTAKLSKSNSKKSIIVKITHLGGNLKDYIIGSIPASFLWIISRLAKCNGGTMFIESYENNKNN